MSHTIEQHRRRAPMWVYEANYTLLCGLLPFLPAGEPGLRAVARSGAGRIMAALLENSPYTQVLELRHDFRPSTDLLPGLEFQVRLYHDARVADVIRYQAHRRLRGRYAYPNEHMFHPDEKRQSNLLLHDWLNLLRDTAFEIDQACPQAC